MRHACCLYAKRSCYALKIRPSCQRYGGAVLVAALDAPAYADGAPSVASSSSSAPGAALVAFAGHVAAPPVPATSSWLSASLRGAALPASDAPQRLGSERDALKAVQQMEPAAMIIPTMDAAVLLLVGGSGLHCAFGLAYMALQHSHVQYAKTCFEARGNVAQEAQKNVRVR